MTIFFYGPNTYAARGQVKQMAEAYVKKTGSDLGLARVDGQSISLQELKSELLAAPFLATSRLVIVSGIGANKSVGAKLADLLAGVPSTTVAVFVEGEIDQRTAVFKALKASDKVMKFEPVSGARLRNWVQKQVADRDGLIDGPATGVLIELAGEDQWRLNNEIAKLVSFDKQVSASSVRELVVPSPERSIFELVDAMTAGQAGTAVKVYRALLVQKQTAMYVLSMVQWQLRNLVIAKSAGKMSPGELARTFGASEFVISKAMTAAGRLSEEKIKRAFVQAVDCEFEIKTGKVKPELGVEMLIQKVAGA